MVVYGKSDCGPCPDKFVIISVLNFASTCVNGKTCIYNVTCWAKCQYDQNAKALGKFGLYRATPSASGCRPFAHIFKRVVPVSLHRIQTQLSQSLVTGLIAVPTNKD